MRKDWREFVPEDFGCSKCDALPGEKCQSGSRSSSGAKIRTTAKVHAARILKCDHEKYVQGLWDRLSWTRFGG